MFVTNNRLILKTCGQTTLLCALEPIMKLVRSTCQLKVQVRHPDSTCLKLVIYELLCNSSITLLYATYVIVSDV